jgi:DNA polymerase
MNVWGDFESYSEVDITTAGGMAYVMHESTNPICFGWAIDNEPVDLWSPMDPEPTRLLNAIADGAQFYAHNMKFDMRLWNYIMHRDFNWPLIDIDNCTDTQALCATYGLPLSLDKAGDAMGIKMTKAKTGKALIKLLCTPKNGGQPHYKDPKYHSKFREMFAYCKRDVEAMRELVGLLPKDRLIPTEHEVWKMTYNMNTKGLPIAYDEVKAIRDYLNKYIEEKMKIVPTLCDNAFQKVTQTIKIKDWCWAQGYKIPDTTAATVSLALEDPSCPANVLEILKLRQELGKSSVAKYVKLLEMALPDENGQYWVYDNLEFHGAGTGRWTGRGFQMHNLPRAKVPNPEEIIAQFMEYAL